MIQKLKRQYRKSQIASWRSILFKVILVAVVLSTITQIATENLTGGIVEQQNRFLTHSSSATSKSPPPGKNQAFQFPDDILRKVEEFKKLQVKYESTIVSAYFELPEGHTKRDNSKYMIWMENFLCINDPVVVFTQHKYVDKMKELRSHATDRTLIVPMEFEDIEVGYNVHWQDKHWHDQCIKYDLGCRVGNERNGNLYKIWLGKTWFVNQVVRIDPFGSNVYTWMDIGHLREGDFFCGDTVVRHPEIVPEDDRILLFMWRPLKEGDELRYENTIFSEGFKSFYIAGSCFGGRPEAWRRFLSKMEESMILYDEQNVGLSEDQSVMQSTCMRNRGLCAVCRPDNDYGVGDGEGGCNEGNRRRFRMCLDKPGWREGVNTFFSAKFRFYHGGPLKVWDPAKGIPSRDEEPTMYDTPLAKPNEKVKEE
jgi:hypothetical protein